MADPTPSEDGRPGMDFVVVDGELRSEAGRRYRHSPHHPLTNHLIAECGADAGNGRHHPRAAAGGIQLRKFGLTASAESAPALVCATRRDRVLIWSGRRHG